MILTRERQLHSESAPDFYVKFERKRRTKML